MFPRRRPAGRLSKAIGWVLSILQTASLQPATVRASAPLGQVCARPVQGGGHTLPAFTARPSVRPRTVGPRRLPPPLTSSPNSITAETEAVPRVGRWSALRRRCPPATLHARRAEARLRAGPVGAGVTNRRLGTAPPLGLTSREVGPRSRSGLGLGSVSVRARSGLGSGQVRPERPDSARFSQFLASSGLYLASFWPHPGPHLDLLWPSPRPHLDLDQTSTSDRPRLGLAVDQPTRGDPLGWLSGLATPGVASWRRPDPQKHAVSGQKARNQLVPLCSSGRSAGPWRGGPSACTRTAAPCSSVRTRHGPGAVYPGGVYRYPAGRRGTPNQGTCNRGARAPLQAISAEMARYLLL